MRYLINIQVNVDKFLGGKPPHYQKITTSLKCALSDLSLFWFSVKIKKSWHIDPGYKTLVHLSRRVLNAFAQILCKSENFNFKSWKSSIYCSYAKLGYASKWATRKEKVLGQPIRHPACNFWQTYQNFETVAWKLLNQRKIWKKHNHFLLKERIINGQYSFR